MALWEILVISVATSMDIFAVTISNTFLHPGESSRRLAWMPVSFAVFQGVFPALGYVLGNLVGDLIEHYAPIVTLCVLGFIGVSMRALEADIVFVGVCNAVVTAAICVAGITLGKRYGHLLGDYALIAGGAVLAVVGVSALF